jgi:hypothetical protein
MKSTTLLWLGCQIVLGLMLLFFISQIAAVEQFSQSQCQQLNVELTDLRAQQRSGLALQLSERIKANEQQLTQQLHFHCASPTAESAALAKAGQRQGQADGSRGHRLAQRRIRQATATATQPARQLTFSSIVSKAKYQGKQLQAWLDYYREPGFCFGVRLTHVMVICAELRQQAQLEFEQLWQQRSSSTLSDQ